MSLAFIFQGGKKVISVTSITLANNTAKTVDITVPTIKRWLLLSAKMTNPDNVTRNAYMFHYKESTKTNFVKTLTTASNLASGAGLQYPNSETGVINKAPFPQVIILDPNETLVFTWDAGGASAGGTDADGLIVEYMEIDV